MVNTPEKTIELNDAFLLITGSDNAYTEWEYTVYHVSIPQDYIWGALDRLAQFFVAPLMLESAVDRELLAIESEFKLNLKSDSCRIQQLLCSTCRRDHPMARFSWGNIRSLREIPGRLGVEPLQELRTFFHRYYYAANMRLCISAAYSLDEMERRVTEMFANVPALPRDNDGPLSITIEQPIASFDCEYRSPMASMKPPLDEGCLGKLFRIIPVKERHVINVTWQLPCQTDLWRSKPADYLAHLLGHEGSGSLLSYFRSMSWASGCMAGVGEEGCERASSHALFTASFILSEDGVTKWKDVVSAIYQYIGMLQGVAKRGWPEWIHEELRDIAEMSYSFGDEEEPEDTVDSIVTEMAPHCQLPSDRLLNGSSLLFEFDEVALKNVLNCLTPENARIDIASTLFGCYEDKELDVEIDPDSNETGIPALLFEQEPVEFDARRAGKPLVEPMFGTLFWAYSLAEDLLGHWKSLTESHDPSIPISLPPPNPYIPTCFDLKALPKNDTRHPLVNAALKVCLPVGKTKQWFTATALQYDERKNQLLLLFEDESEDWYTLDEQSDFFGLDRLTFDFESTMNKKKVRFKIVEVAKQGAGPIRRFGDENDDDVQDGKGFPPIPPVLKASRLPKQIHNSNSLKMWYLQDRNYNRPTAELRLQVICCSANSSPLHRACAELMVDLCADKCLEKSYLASVCELESRISATDSGFSLRFHGFDDKLLTLFDIFFETLLSFRGVTKSLPDGISEARFNALLEILRRKYRNSGMSASTLSGDIRLHCLRSTIWTSGAKLAAVDELGIPMFVSCVSNILDQVTVECLFHGNVDLALAKEAGKRIADRVGSTGLSRKGYPAQTVAKLPEAESPLVITLPSKDATDPNTAVEVYTQIGKDNLKDRTLLSLLAYMMDEPIYDQVSSHRVVNFQVLTPINHIEDTNKGPIWIRRSV